MRWLVLLGLVACSGAPDASLPRGASGTAADAGTAATANPLPACPEADGVLARAAKKLEAELSAAKGTGGIVAVLCNGHITSRPVGSVRAGGEAVKETTRFQFASITKSFTAATALALASAGKVKLSEPITTYVPFVAATYPGARPIALGDLLSHTAGYAVDIPNASYEDDSLEGWFKANGAEKPWSPPGAVFNYSNLGFSLAGLALLTDVLATGGGPGFYDLVAVVVAFSSAWVVITIRQLHAAGVHTATIFSAQCAYGLLVCLGPAVVWFAPPSPLAWVVMTLAAVCAGGGQIFMTRGFADLAVGRGSLLQMLVPLGVAAGGVVFFHEHFRPAEIVGGLLIVAGTALPAWRRASNV